MTRAIMAPAWYALEHALDELRDLKPRLLTKAHGYSDRDSGSGSAKEPRVLVVDDDSDMVFLLGEHLLQWGFPWRSVSTMADAVVELQGGGYRSLLLDWRALCVAEKAPLTIAGVAELASVYVGIWTAAPEAVPDSERARYPVFDKVDWPRIEKWLKS